MKILVTGGAGYIGSVMTRQLVESGNEVVVIDNLSEGHKDAIDPKAEFIETDLHATETLRKVFTDHSFDAVMHFAAALSVAESMENPGKYFNNNTFGTLQLLQAMVAKNVKYMIFSSTAGVYGNPTTIPIPEDHETNPTHAYGESKLLTERILQWFDVSHSIKSVSLRYFNAAGATLDKKIGERHKNETHIIPLAIQAATSRKEFKLYGDDYDTPDGTCIRDYIHVEDLCEAHIRALSHVQNTNKSAVYNIGTGHGHSNKEVVEMVEKITGEPINIKIAPRRSGDPDQLIADSAKIMHTTGWKPKYSDLKTIVESAWEFHRQHKHS